MLPARPQPSQGKSQHLWVGADLGAPPQRCSHSHWVKITAGASRKPTPAHPFHVPSQLPASPCSLPCKAARPQLLCGIGMAAPPAFHRLASPCLPAGRRSRTGSWPRFKISPRHPTPSVPAQRGHGTVPCGSLVPRGLPPFPAARKPPPPQTQPQSGMLPPHNISSAFTLPCPALTSRCWGAAAGIRLAKVAPSQLHLLGRRCPAHIWLHRCPLPPPQSSEEADGGLPAQNSPIHPSLHLSAFSLAES